MLLQRILTALFLLPAAIAAILLLPRPLLAVVFAAVAALAAWEWAALADLRTPRARWLYAAPVAAVTLLLSESACWGGTLAALGNAWLGAALLWWLYALRWLLRFPVGFGTQSPTPALRRGLGFLLVPAAVSGLIDLHARVGAAGLLTVFALVWAADIGAYFCGRAWGRHKLAPAVSPGKTWEGFAGGLAAAAAVAGLAYYALPGLAAAVHGALPQWIALAVAVTALSVVGDLFESLLKRLAGVKDSSNLLPGHGGVLDRIDSILAAAPAMALGLQVLTAGR